METEHQLRLPMPDGPFAPTWDSLLRYQVPKWYEDAKFGIFIHWGVYSVPGFGNEWYPRNMYQRGTKEFEHHIATYGPHKQFGYKDFIPQFKAERFDADAWAELFRRSGAKFVVPVAEHHDGFAMYDTKLSKWNAVQMGPKRDVLGLLAQAVRKREMVFGLSSHRIEHWWFMNGGKEFESDVQDPACADFYGPCAAKESQPGKEFMLDWYARCAELVDNYRPQIFWFDWWIEQPSVKPWLKNFAAYYYNRAAEWGQGVAINYKHDAYVPGTAVFDVERGQLADIRPMYWQTDTAVGKNSWGYVKEMQYKEPAGIVGDLIDIVSKNGALLLNIGPRPDGLIPEQDQQILLEIGRWLDANGEAIFGTRPWKMYGEGPTEVPEGHFTDTKRGDYSSEDIRFTTRGHRTLYATSLGRVREGQTQLTIRSLGRHLRLLTRPVEQVQLVATGEPLSWSQDPEGLKVTLPSGLQGRYGVALKLSVGAP